MPYKKKDSLFSKAMSKQNAATKTKPEPANVAAPVNQVDLDTPIIKAVPQKAAPQKAAPQKPKVSADKPVKTAKAFSPFKIIVPIMIAAAVILVGVFAYFSLNNYKEQVLLKESNVLSNMGRVIIPSGHFTPAVVQDFTFLKGMKAAKVTPGVDLYQTPEQDQAALETQVDGVIENLATLGFNSLIVDTKMQDMVIYNSSILKKTPVDLLQIIVDKAKGHNISVVAVFNATGIATADGSVIDSYLATDDKLLLNDAATELAGYEITSILVDNYYAARNASSYDQYIQYGTLQSYSDWLYTNTQATINGIKNAVSNSANPMPTGLLVKDVWADQKTNEQGSKTESEFSALKDGFVDTKKLIEEKNVDFVSVEIETSLSDTKKSFKEISGWWDGVCSASNTPLYITHRGERANSSEFPGWNGTGQLAQQVATVDNYKSYGGSAFTGLSNMIEDKDTSTALLLKHYEGTYEEKDLFQGLKMTTPSGGKTSFVVYEPTFQFRGNFDPTLDVLINGKKIEPSSRGGFSEWVELKVGKNQIVVEHKGEKITYNVERKVIIFKEWKPQGNIKVSGSTQLEISAIGYIGADTYATINGTKVPLNAGGGDDTILDSNYQHVVGYYTVPKAGSKEQNIGSITFSGTYEGYPETRQGASVTIDKLPDEVDPDEATGQVLQHAIVNPKYAYTYPLNTTPEFPQGILYQLPAGTQDIVQSVNGNFVNLRSGKTVKLADVTLTDIPFVGNNRISSFTAGVEGNDTVIRMTMDWKVPFSVNPSPYPTETGEMGKGFRFSANTITVLLDYTTTHSKDSFMDSISSSPLFTGMTVERIKNAERNIWQYKLTLPLSNPGKYYGVHAEYEGNDLVMRFNHSQSGSLSGMTIVVDPGHGGKDNGTMAGRDVLEKDVNLPMAMALKEQLEANGATVVMTRTSDEGMADPARVSRIQAANPDLVIAVHHNSAAPNSKPNGVETYYNTPFSQPLAAAVQAQLINHIGDRGSKQYNFFQIRGKQCPAILIEYGFLSNPNDEALALDPNHRLKMAQSTVQGIINYYS